MQQASTSHDLLPARHEAQPHIGRPVQRGTPAHIGVGEVDGTAQPDVATVLSVEARPGRTYPNKQISTGGKCHVPLRRNVLLTS